NSADNLRALEIQRMEEAAAMERLGITDATDRRGQDITSWTSRLNNSDDNRTTMRGQDIGASTSRLNNSADNLRALETNRFDNERALQTNRLDNQRSALTDLYQPLNPGQ